MALDPERAKRARRWVLGCTGGCLGAIVILGVVGYLVARHFYQAMPIVPPQTFLTRDTSAFAFVRVDPAVPLTMETALDVVMLPEMVSVYTTESGQARQPDRKMAGDFITSIAPLQAVVVLQPEEKGRVIHGGLALSVRSGSRLLSLVVRQKLAATFVPFEGAEIARLARDAFVALYANNYMSSDREDLIKAWIGNLNAERARRTQAAQGVRPAAPPLSISPALRRAYDRLDAGQPLVFATLNSHRELVSLASLITDEQARRFIEERGVASDAVLSLAGQIKPLSNRDAELTVFADCINAETAAQMRDGLINVAGATGDKWPLTDMTVEIRDDTTLVVTARIVDLPAKVAGMVAAVIHRTQGEGGKPAPAPQPAAAPL
jgi:hypothetical protein